jgi:hypothetical protein
MEHAPVYSTQNVMHCVTLGATGVKAQMHPQTRDSRFHHAKKRLRVAPIIRMSSFDIRMSSFDIRMSSFELTRRNRINSTRISVVE